MPEQGGFSGSPGPGYDDGGKSLYCPLYLSLQGSRDVSHVINLKYYFRYVNICFWVFWGMDEEGEAKGRLAASIVKYVSGESQDNDR